MRHYTTDFRERNSTAAKAKNDLLAKFKLGTDPNNPAVIQRRADRQAIVEARAARMAQREAGRIAREKEAAEEAALQAKKAAEQAALEAEGVAKIERDKAAAEERNRREKAQHLALLVAADKSIRDAKIAARKGGKKERREALVRLSEYEKQRVN